MPVRLVTPRLGRALSGRNPFSASFPGRCPGLACFSPLGCRKWRRTPINKWRECKLGDLLEIKHGYAFPGEYFADSGTHIVLTPGNFHDSGGFKSKDREKYYTGPIPSDYVLDKNDLTVAMTEQAESLLGSSAIIPRGGLYLDNQRLGLVQVRNRSEANTHYLYYLFNSKPVRQQTRGSAGGTKIRHTAPSRIGEVKVSVPSLSVRRRIAGILLAYDELMENCQRRIRILEKMARALYREWFVHFRFPAHENVPCVDSPVGPIPKGWEVMKLGDLTALLNRGLSPSCDENGDSVVINQKCVRDEHLNLSAARRQTKPIPPDKRIRFGDVLINSTGVGTLGRVPQVYEDLEACTVDTHVTIARPATETDLDFFGCALLTQQDTFDRLGIGATGQTELSRTAIGQVELVLPPSLIQARFGALVRPIRSAAMTLSKKIENLRRTRDLLLPRFLSGQVPLDVSEDVAEPTTSAPPPRLPRSQTPFGNALAGETPFRGGGEARAKAEEATELRGQARAQIEFGHEVGGEEPALRVAEEAPPNPRNTGFPPVRTAGFQPAEPTACGQDAREPHKLEARVPDETPVPIHQTERTDVLQIIRQVFSEGPPRSRDDAIRDVARALGSRRTGARIAEVLHADLHTAVRRGILENTDATLRLCARSITDLDRDFLKTQSLAAIGRPWIDRDTAILDFCRWLGFARTGPVIEDTARSLIHGLLREGRLEASGVEMIRRA